MVEDTFLNHRREHYVKECNITQSTHSELNIFDFLLYLIQDGEEVVRYTSILFALTVRISKLVAAWF